MNNKRIVHFNSPEFEQINIKKSENERLIQELNCDIQTNESLRELVQRITGQNLPISTEISLPFQTDYGANIQIGDNCFINKNNFFIDLGGITIGTGCLLGPNVTLISVNHVQDIQHRRDVELSEVVLQDNVWLGANVTVLPGVTIGQGSIVGANSLVTKDVPENVVVAGSPAKIIKTI